MSDYKFKCGSCKFFEYLEKDGKVLKRGRCTKRARITQHQASDKCCQQYYESEEQYGR